MKELEVIDYDKKKNKNKTSGHRSAAAYMNL